MFVEIETLLRKLISKHNKKVSSIELVANAYRVEWRVILNEPQGHSFSFRSSIDISIFFEDNQIKGKTAPMPINKPSLPERSTAPHWRKRAKKLFRKANRLFMCACGSLFIGYLAVAFCLQKPDTTTWTVDQRTGYLILCTVLFIVIGKYSRTLKLNLDF